MSSSAAGSKLYSYFPVEIREGIYCVYTVLPMPLKDLAARFQADVDVFAIDFHHGHLVVGTVAMAWTGYMKDQGSILSNLKHFLFSLECPDRHCSLSSLLTNGQQRIFSCR